MLTAAPNEPSQLILIDDLDELSLGTVVALDALKAVTQLLDGQAEGNEVRGKLIAALLRCIHSRAAERWPVREGDC